MMPIVAISIFKIQYTYHLITKLMKNNSFVKPIIATLGYNLPAVYMKGYAGVPLTTHAKRYGTAIRIRQLIFPKPNAVMISMPLL